jgi:hypothetical protein
LSEPPEVAGGSVCWISAGPIRYHQIQHSCKADPACEEVAKRLGLEIKKVLANAP